MPLPDADSPKKSKLYDNLAPKVLGGFPTQPNYAFGSEAPIRRLSIDDLDTMSNAIRIQGDNEDELRRLLLIREAANMHPVGPIPIPGTIQNVVITGLGVTTLGYLTPQNPGSQKSTVPAGQVWVLSHLVATNIVSSGGTNYFRIYNVDTETDVSTELVYTNLTDITADGEIEDMVLGMFCDNRSALAIYATNSGGTFTSANFTAVMYRVR